MNEWLESSRMIRLELQEVADNNPFADNIWGVKCQINIVRSRRPNADGVFIYMKTTVI